MKIFTTSILAFILCFIEVSAQDTLYVNEAALSGGSGSAWGSAFLNLQDALVMAGPGDQIWVASGTYRPQNHRDSTIRLKAGVDLYGGFAGNEDSLTQRVKDSTTGLYKAHSTVLSGDIGIPGDSSDNSYTVISAFDLAQPVVLDGFVVRAGYANVRHNNSTKPDSTDAYGGGVYLKNADLHIQHCLFDSNYAFFGGAIYLTDGATLTVARSYFNTNNGRKGGAIYGEITTIHISECEFKENKGILTIPNFGGAINARQTSLNITNCDFLDNEATYGGAILTIDNALDTLIIDSCRFTGNIASERGGGILNDGTKSKIRFCTFENNTLEPIPSTTDIGGGGIYNDRSYILVDNCQFNQNRLYPPTSSGDGGAILFASDTAFHDSSLIQHTTFSNNFARNGGAIHVGSGSYPTIYACLFEGNKAKIEGGAIDIDEQSSFTLIDSCTFRNNECEKAHGGAIHIVKSPIRIQNSFFHHNITLFNGGAIYNHNSASRIDSCFFEGNIAKGEYQSGGGGGITNWHSDSFINYCTFIDNQVGDSAVLAMPTTSMRRFGGGIYNESSRPVITYCNFQNNQSFRGGGMANKTGSSPKLFYCIFDSNRGEFGGGVYNENNSTLLLDHCTFNNNVAFSTPSTTKTGRGGGLFTTDSNPEVWDCEFSNNSSINEGAGVYDEYGFGFYRRSTFSQNQATKGGGIHLFVGESIIDSCVFDNNTAFDKGGGLYYEGEAEPNNKNHQSISNSIISGNTATVGGGLYSTGFRGFGDTTLTIVGHNCSLIDNIAINGAGAYFDQDAISFFTRSTFAQNHATKSGGGIFQDSLSSSSFDFCTIGNNIADSIGGGIFFHPNAYANSLGRTIVAQNINGDLQNHSVPLISLGHNLVSDTTNANVSVLATDLVGDQNSPLDALFDGNVNSNGGFTPSLALHSASPAIGKGPKIYVDFLQLYSVDQRGYSTEIGSRNDSIDIGAYEYQHTFVRPTIVYQCNGDDEYLSSRTLTITDSTGGAWRTDSDSIQRLELSFPPEIILDGTELRVRFIGEALKEDSFYISGNTIIIQYLRTYTNEVNSIRISGFKFRNSTVGRFSLNRTGGNAIQLDNQVLDSVAHGLFSFFPVIEFSEEITQYVDAFETEKGWFQNLDKETPLWQWGSPNGSVIAEPSSVNKVWTTNLTDSYGPGENDWLSSPCFDFSTLKNPMISFQTWIDSETGLDGSVLEYSTNNGDSWEEVGTDASGLNWYNTNFLAANIGDLGWTGRGTSWKRSAHVLDHLGNEPQVRFRLVFKSIASVLPTATNNGFAFDDLYLGTRARKVLEESFIDINDPQLLQQKQLFTDQFINDVIPIVFPMGRTNSEFLANPGEILTQGLKYGISTADRIVLGGNDFSSPIDSLTRETYDTSRLDLPRFLIELDSMKASKICVTALTAYPFPTSIQVAIVEDIKTQNGTTISHVFRKFLPNPSGTKIESWQAGQPKGILQKWDQENLPSPAIAQDFEALSVIVWVQDEESKEIIQSAKQKVWSELVDPTHLRKRSLNQPFPEQIAVYPIPVKDLLYLSLPLDTNPMDQIMILDLYGRLVLHSSPLENAEIMELNVSSLASGAYFLLLLSEGKTIFRKRIMISP